MAMEYAKGGDLYNYVKAYGYLKEPVARCASGQAVHAGWAGSEAGGA